MLGKQPGSFRKNYPVNNFLNVQLIFTSSIAAYRTRKFDIRNIVKTLKNVLNFILGEQPEIFIKFTPTITFEPFDRFL
jgi:hypothetical protein